MWLYGAGVWGGRGTYAFLRNCEYVTFRVQILRGAGDVDVGDVDCLLASA